MPQLTSLELQQLLHSVFPGWEKENLALLVDLPVASADNDDWQERRRIAQEWYDALHQEFPAVALIVFADVRSNNAQLPEHFFPVSQMPGNWPQPPTTRQLSQQELLQKYPVMLAMTEYSATAPLKILAKKHPFRAATMAGFSSKMFPALRLDYQKISQRVELLKQKLDPAEAAEVLFQVGEKEYRCFFDLRFSQAHLSAGRFPEKGMVGNFPSGETYIVPFEGDEQHASWSEGTLPVQLAEEVVLYQIQNNRAIKVISTGKRSAAEAEKLRQEPAYGNIAELGFGVLGDFGLEPINEVLLDEKLGFHIAFGRSDHFGGKVGPEAFCAPENVVHLDRVYIPAIQPQVQLLSVKLCQGSSREEIIRDGEYLLF